MSMKALLLSLIVPASVYAWGDDKPECLNFGSSAFVGFGLGLGSATFKSSGTSTNIANVAGQASGTSANYDFVQGIPTSGSAATGFLFTPQLGWNCRLRNTRVVFGVIAGGALSTMKTTIAYPSVLVSKNGNNVSTVAGSLNYARISDGGWFDIGFRFGVVAGSAMLYIPFGWSIHSWTAHATLSGVNFSSSKWTNCFWTGLGVDFNLTPNIVLGAGAEVHISSKTQFSFNVGQGYTASIKSRATILALLASIKYAFPASQ